MNIEILLNEYGLKIAQEQNAIEVRKLTAEYEKTHDPKIKNKIIKLILDRDEINKNNMEIIRKYVKIGDNNKWIKKN